MKMKRCPRCHKLSKYSANFCKYCGYKFTGPFKLNQQQSSSSSNQPTKSATNARSSQSSSTQPSRLQRLHESEPTSKKNAKSNKSNAQAQVKQATEKQNQQNIRQATTRPVKPTRQNYAQNWKKANQSVNKASQFSNNYFQWLLKSIEHPLQSNPGHPFFGITSFIIEALLAYFAAVLSIGVGGLTASYSQDLYGWLPLNVYFQNNQYACTAIGFAFVLIFDFLGYIGINYLISLIGSHKKLNLFASINSLASYTNLAMFANLLFLASVLINKPSLVWLFEIIINGIFGIGLGLRVYNNTKDNSKYSLYYAFVSFLAKVLLNGIIITIIGVVMGLA